MIERMKQNKDQIDRNKQIQSIHDQKEQIMNEIEIEKERELRLI